MNGVVIQARTGSKRYPNKCFATIKTRSADGSVLEKPSIWYTVNTCRVALAMFDTIVAVPKGDDCLIEWCQENRVLHYEGDPVDVLGRYVACAKVYKLDGVVRVTADCPIIPVETLYTVGTICAKVKAAFGSNVCGNNLSEPRTTIDGSDVEYMSCATLDWLDKRAKTKGHREHVTKYIYDNPEEASKALTPVITFPYPIDLSGIKTSIDTKEDLDRVQEMVYKGDK